MTDMQTRIRAEVVLHCEEFSTVKAELKCIHRELITGFDRMRASNASILVDIAAVDTNLTTTQSKLATADSTLARIEKRLDITQP